MIYPYLLYSRRIDHRPIFNGLDGDPCVVDLSHRNPLLAEIDVRNQRHFQAILDAQMGDHRWGVAGYLERRDSLLRGCPQMIAENRLYHLGLDILVPMSTPLHAPLNAVVAESGYEPGEANYGGFVLLRHESPLFDAFYSFYGHLGRGSLPAAGQRIAAGEPFAAVGDFHENGNWFYHTHLQVITERGFSDGYVSKGYCARSDLAEMNDLCPSPLPLFKT
jgi:hypothetical protein